MTVYVDDGRWQLGRMLMCHMVADTTEELLRMADTIGLQRKWLQHAGSPKEHFDISLGKRGLAIANGAVPITRRELSVFMAEKLAFR